MDILRYLSYLPLRRSRILSVAARFFCMPVFSMVLHRHSAPISFQALFFMIYEDYIHAAFSFRLFVNWGSEGIPKMPCPHPHVGSLRSKMLRVFNPPDT